MPKEGKEWPGQGCLLQQQWQTGVLIKLTTYFLNFETCHCYTKSQQACYVVIISCIFTNCLFFSYSVSVFHVNLNASVATGPGAA